MGLAIHRGGFVRRLEIVLGDVSHFRGSFETGSLSLRIVPRGEYFKMEASDNSFAVYFGRLTFLRRVNGAQRIDFDGFLPTRKVDLPPWFEPKTRAGQSGRPRKTGRTGVDAPRTQPGSRVLDRAIGRLL
jgi:hypothetical protein